MEDPKRVGHVLWAVGLLVVGAGVASSVWLRSVTVLTAWLVAAAVVVVACVGLALVNLAVFAPVFWLWERIGAARKKVDRQVERRRGRASRQRQPPA